jgi:predicted transcriptional regulator
MATLKNKDKRQELRHDLYHRLETVGVPLPQAVKELRKILGINQADFAKMIGQSLSTLRKIEQSSGNITFDSVHKILETFSLELVVKRRQNT